MNMCSHKRDGGRVPFDPDSSIFNNVKIMNIILITKNLVFISTKKSKRREERILISIR